MKKALYIFPFLLFTLAFIFICVIFIFTSQYLRRSENTFNTDLNQNNPIVIIDAGHGGEDGGAIGANGSLEKDLNLQIAEKLKTILSSMGIKSVLTRESDTLLYDRNDDYTGQKKRLDMQKRLEIASSYDNAIFISIHQNSFPQEKYSGFQIYYSPNNESSNELAKIIELNIKESLQPNNTRSAKSSDGSIYLLDRLSCTALLIECGFLSNQAECELLCTDEYQNQLCIIIACSIERFLAKKHNEGRAS